MATSVLDLRALSDTDVKQAIPSELVRAALSGPPFVHVPGTFNVRDLGLAAASLPAGGGEEEETKPAAGVFRPGFAYRAGALQGLTAEGRAVLSGNGGKGLGVRRVFDLRSQREHADAPDPAVEGAENVWAETKELDALVGLDNFVEGVGERGYELMYLDVLKVYRPSIRAVLEHVRDRPHEPFLFHCTAGRDRTGVVAGLLMSLAGEHPEVVAHDFMLSRVGTEPAREQLVAFARHGTGAASDDAPGFYNLCNLRRRCWNAFLAGVERDYGGFERYVVEALGFPPAEVGVIRENLRAAPN